jgi:hypothetical protein
MAKKQIVASTFNVYSGLLRMVQKVLVASFLIRQVNTTYIRIIYVRIWSLLMYYIMVSIM